MSLTNLEQSFILHLGEMGNRWGINRTVGQIYALMFLKNEPICADEISDKLGFSRSNISTSLKELLSWNLIKLLHLPNDRRDFYVTPSDVWAIFKILLTERKKREIDPTLTMLRDSLINNEDNNEQAKQKMQSMLEVVEIASEVSQLVENMSSQDILKSIKVFRKIHEVVKFKHKVLKNNENK